MQLPTHAGGPGPDDPVGVVVVNYNAGEWIQECLQSLAAQTRRADRIIVVDNASEDGSREWLIDHAASIDPAVEVIAADSNLGFAVANNLAIEKLGDMRWIALLNPDAAAQPYWLEAMLVASHASKEYTFFGSRMLNASNTSQVDGIGDVYHASGLVWREGHGRDAQPSDDEAREIFSPCAAAALYRRDQVVAVGGFEEKYFCYSEDVDLGFRLRLAGHRCLYVPDSIVLHEGSGTTGATSPFTIYHGHRNLVWTYIKNMPGYLFWMYLPQHLVMNVVSVVFLTVKGRGLSALKAKAHAIAGLGWALRERRQVQAARKASVADIKRALSRGFLTPYLSRHESKSS